VILSRCIHLVVSAKVEISQIAGKGKEVLLEIVRLEELFGESAFSTFPIAPSRPTALEKASVMTWAIVMISDGPGVVNIGHQDHSPRGRSWCTLACCGAKCVRDPLRIFRHHLRKTENDSVAPLTAGQALPRNNLV